MDCPFLMTESFISFYSLKMVSDSKRIFNNGAEQKNKRSRYDCEIIAASPCVRAESQVKLHGCLLLYFTILFLFGMSGGVSFMQENARGKHAIRKLSDMSYLN